MKFNLKSMMVNLSFISFVLAALVNVVSSSKLRSSQLSSNPDEGVSSTVDDSSEVFKLPSSTPTVVADSSEIKLASSMETLMQDEKDDPASPKAKLEKKLVALIWLEKVLQQNYNSMNEEAYKEKIALGKDKLTKDTTPAMAAMLGMMRTELYEFSVPFYQNAVTDEMKKLRTRQKKLLDQIITLDAKEPADAADASEASAEPAAVAKPAKAAQEVKDAAAEAAKAPPVESEEERKAKKERRRKQSNTITGIMVGIMTSLLCFVLFIAWRVHSHVRST